MREILFRGKLKSNLEWFYGDKITELGTGKVFIADLASFNENTKLVEVMEEVIPETAGQFTGKFDKNGKKIFEGDIVDLLGFGLGEIKWVSRDVMFAVEGLDFHEPLGICRNHEIEVISNIHDKETKGTCIRCGSNN